MFFKYINRMEACTSKKRVPDKNTDWTLCLICQERDRKKFSGTRILNDAGIARIQQVVIDRKQYNDVANWDTIERLEHVSLTEIAKETDILYHKDCYTTFTSAQHISRQKAKFDKLSSSEIPCSSTQQNEQPALRSVLNSKLNTSRCIFCQEESSKKTYLFARLDVSDAVIEAARSDYDMRYKLAGISDLVAADARYHLHCYVNFRRRTSGDTAKTHDPVKICIQRVVQELSTGLSHGEIYNLLDVWNRYSELLSEFQIEAGLYRDNKTRFKDKLIKASTSWSNWFCSTARITPATAIISNQSSKDCGPDVEEAKWWIRGCYCAAEYIRVSVFWYRDWWTGTTRATPHSSMYPRRYWRLFNMKSAQGFKTVDQ